tara:strand:+ start:943 stop:1311 length:369 start_codon:yes stop_codon:yes gene_type:complete
MELGPRELMTLGTVLSGLAATWGLVRAQISRLTDEYNDLRKEIDELHTRLDKAESFSAVSQHQLEVIAQIISPERLRIQTEREASFMAEIREKISALELESNRMHSMHNSVHLPVASTMEGK